MEKEIIKPTYGMAFKIWWALTMWQIFTVLFFMLVGLMVVAKGPFFILSSPAPTLFFFFLAAIAFLFVMISAYAMQEALKTKFKDFLLISFQRTTHNKEIIEQQIQPTYKIALKFWWAFFWRSALLGLVLSYLIGFIIGFYCGFKGIPLPETLITVFSYLTGFFASIHFMKKLLNKKFKTFSIYTVEHKTNPPEKTEV